MGKVLQVRVAVTTYDEAEVKMTWPRAYGVGFPDERLTPPSRVRGVMELVDGLTDQARFGDISDEVRRVLDERLPDLQNAKSRVEECLADWKPAEANTWTDTLEDRLDDLERDLPRP
jgi:hypothetical protein